MSAGLGGITLHWEKTGPDKENRLIARDSGGGRGGGSGNGGGGVEHVSDVAFLMPVQMSRSTWIGEGGGGEKHLCNRRQLQPLCC